MPARLDVINTNVTQLHTEVYALSYHTKHRSPLSLILVFSRRHVRIVVKRQARQFDYCTFYTLRSFILAGRGDMDVNRRRVFELHRDHCGHGFGRSAFTVQLVINVCMSQTLT